MHEKDSLELMRHVCWYAIGYRTIENVIFGTYFTVANARWISFFSNFAVLNKIIAIDRLITIWSVDMNYRTPESFTKEIQLLNTIIHLLLSNF